MHQEFDLKHPVSNGFTLTAYTFLQVHALSKLYFHTFHITEAGDVINSGNRESYGELHRAATKKQTLRSDWPFGSCCRH